jgi:hypothetical protein
MARIRFSDVLAVMAFALAAIGVSSASAAEVGECLKVPKVEGVFHGKYTDKGCAVPATPTEEAEGKLNKYEWSPGVTPAHAAFEAKTKFNEMNGSAGRIECQKSSTVGEWTGPKAATEQTTFTGCRIRSELTNECHSEGQAGGTVVTDKLDVTLLGEGEESFNLTEGGEPAPVTVGIGEVWEQLRGPGGELSAIQAEFECAKTVVIRSEGSLAGVVPAASIDVPLKKVELGFGEGKGAQGVSLEANIIGKGFVPAGRTVWIASQKVKYTGKIEFRT